MSGGRFNLSALAVREGSITLFLVLLIAVAGTLAFFQLGRAEDPPFTVKQMTIITAWPGATAQEMQDQVAEPLEKRMQELKWYDRSETYTRAGLAFTMVSLLDSTPPAQVQEEFYQARKKLGDEARTLPAGVIGPMINDEFSDVTFAVYALKARGEPQRQLVREAESLRQRLLHVPGVKKVNIIGEQAERIFVSFSHDRLATLGVTAQDIFAALNSQNALTPAGSVDTSGPQVVMRLDGAFDTLAKIRDTPIAVQGRTLKLADVATVERGYEDPATFLVRNAGEPALLLGVVMREGWNGLDLGAALEAETASINDAMPLGMALDKVTDQAVNISSSVDEFMVKFFVALLVVMLVCFISMGWRVGVVVAAAVPLTLAIVFVVMAATGKNFDRITLGSLILALGLLVDDAIIAVEMMVRKMEEGYEKYRAATFAYEITAKPMLTGTLITAAGFLPIGMAKSMTGEYTFAIFAVTVIALVLSWFASVYFVPYLGMLLLKRPPHAATLPPEVASGEVPIEETNLNASSAEHEVFDSPFYNRFRRAVNWCVTHRWLTIAITVLVFALGLVGMSRVQQQFFPDSSRPEVLVDIWFPEGTSLAANEAVTRRVEERFMQLDGVRTVSEWVGSGVPRFYLPLDQVFPQSNVSQFIVVPQDLKVRESLRVKLPALLAEEFPEVRGRVKLLPNGPPVPYPVQFRVVGPDPLVLRERADEVTVSYTHLTLPTTPYV